MRGTSYQNSNRKEMRGTEGVYISVLFNIYKLHRLSLFARLFLVGPCDGESNRLKFVSTINSGNHRR